LDDPRGNLMLTYLAIAAKYQPTWIVWENVPGVLSSGGGEDFATFLRGLGECGYGFAYRVLDAQYFGVAQRRRRVFVVGCLGDWRRAATVLFDASSLSGNPAPIREKRERTSPYVADCAGTLCARDYKGLSTDDLHDGKVIINVYDHHPQDSRVCEVDVSARLNCRLGNLPIALQDTSGREKSQNGKGWSEGVSYTVDTTGLQGVAHAFKVRGGCEGGGKGYLGQDEKAFTISTTQDQQLYANMAVRRLTPIECERLQGFPDNYTNIKNNCPDGPRYKALGNSMAVPVMKWIGTRIDKLEKGLL
jgi:DNA (cytosine-5)-methyltransferase 1